jgi:hypothetical protein
MHEFEAAAGYRLADFVWFGVTKRAQYRKGTDSRVLGDLGLRHNGRHGCDRASCTKDGKMSVLSTTYRKDYTP